MLKALNGLHFTGLTRSFGAVYLTLLDRFQASEAATSFVVCLYSVLRYTLGETSFNLIL